MKIFLAIIIAILIFYSLKALLILGNWTARNEEKRLAKIIDKTIKILFSLLLFFFIFVLVLGILIGV